MSSVISSRVLSLAVLALLTTGAFLVSREARPNSYAKADPLTAPTPQPGVPVCGKDLAPDRSVIRSYCIPGTPPTEFWYVPLMKEDEAKPRFDGTINGIRLGISVDPGTELGPCAGVSPGSPGTGPIPEAETIGSPLEIAPRYLPPNTVVANLFHAGKCAGVIASAEKGFTILADPASGRFGGPVNIFRFRGAPQMTLDAPTDRVSSGSVKGLPAVLVRPLTGSGFGESAVVIREDFGLTVLRASGIPLVELIRIAESLYQ